MNLCGTCKHWGFWTDDDGVKQVDTSEYEPGDYRTCGKIPFNQDPGADESKAQTSDGSGYFAALDTREDFGCVLHEPKE